MTDRRQPRRTPGSQPELKEKRPPIGWRWVLAIVPMALNMFVIFVASWALVSAIRYVEFVFQTPVVGG